MPIVYTRNAYEQAKQNFYGDGFTSHTRKYIEETPNAQKLVDMAVLMSFGAGNMGETARQMFQCQAMAMMCDALFELLQTTEALRNSLELVKNHLEI